MADKDPIHIKASRKGTFTDAALKHHEGVQAFAHHIVADPGRYSSDMRKKAQFAINASKWHH